MRSRSGSPAPVTLLAALGLADRLASGRGATVAAVGAGGKTSLLWALALETAGRLGPEKVVFTTTTRIYEPSLYDLPPLVRGSEPESPENRPDSGQPSPVLRLVGGPAEARAVLGEGAGRNEIVVLGTGLVDSGKGRRKVRGLPPEWVDELRRSVPGLTLLVEADGAAGKPLKAPAAHEPVIPASADLVLAVAGIDAVGLRLDPDSVHRPELIARLTGLAPGQRLGPREVALVLRHAAGAPSGPGTGRPPGAEAATGLPRAAARPVYILNKVGSETELADAQAVVAELKTQVPAPPPRVVLTCCRRWPVVVAVC